MATWDPYPVTQPERSTGNTAVPPAEFEAPPWQAAPDVVAPGRSAQDLVPFQPREGAPANPDLDGDGKLDAAERAYAANLRNRRRWRKPTVSYRASDGWERGHQARGLEANRELERRIVMAARVRKGMIRLMPISLAMVLTLAFGSGPWAAGAVAILGLMLLVSAVRISRNAQK